MSERKRLLGVAQEPTVEYIPATERLGHSAPLAYSVQYPVLGIPILFQSNSETVIEQVDASFRQWATLAPQWQREQPAKTVTIIVQPMHQADGQLHKATYRIHNHIYLGASNDTLFYADNTRGEGLAFVPPEVVENRVHFRHNIVESLAFYLASIEERVAIHAGILRRNDHTTFLMGPSTIGKSTLCYAALRTGEFQLLSEDVAFVQVNPTPQIFGGLARLHLLPDAVRYFPELETAPPTVQANGKLKIGIVVPPEQVCLHTDGGTVCLLQRHAGTEAWLEPIARDVAIHHIINPRESGYDLFTGAALQAVAQAVTRGATYRLHIGTDLEKAVNVLRELTNELTLERL